MTPFIRPYFKLSEPIHSFFASIHLCWASVLYNQKVLIHYQHFKKARALVFFQKDHQRHYPKSIKIESPSPGICYSQCVFQRIKQTGKTGKVWLSPPMPRKRKLLFPSNTEEKIITMFIENIPRAHHHIRIYHSRHIAGHGQCKTLPCLPVSCGL